MALSGTIQDFGVAEIFQLIGQQVKTGRLSLSKGGEVVHVDFRDGWVIWAERNGGTFDQTLSEALVKAELLSMEHLRQAREIQKQTLERLPSILVSRGYLRDSELRQMVSLQVSEVLFALFRWSKGRYEFKAQEITEHELGPEPMHSESLIMNATRMVDEWPQIRRRVPRFDWVAESLGQLPASGTHTSGLEIDESAHRVFELLHQRPTVRRLVETSRLGEFETCRVLADLVAAQFARVGKPESPQSTVSTDSSRAALAYLGKLLTSGAIIVAMGAMVLRLLWQAEGPRELGLERRDLHHRVEAVELRLLERAVELFRLEQGRSPEGLNDLIDAGLYVPSERPIRREPVLEADGGIRFGPR